MTHDYFAIRNNMTEEHRLDFFHDMREEYNMETYEDFADMCSYLSIMCDNILALHSGRVGELDDVEISNLMSLKDMLRICATMFIMCDNYYRYGKLSTYRYFPNTEKEY